MSWLYGYFAIEREPKAPILRAFDYFFESRHLKLYAGGKRNIQVLDSPIAPDEKLFILGDPILRLGENFRYPDLADWASLLQNESRLNTLDGHYLILIASEKGIRTYNDPLCKRSLWIHKEKDSYFFCSEIALLKEAKRAELDLHHFGAYWHSLFPAHKRHYTVSTHSYFKDVDMLYQSGSLILTKDEYALKHRLFEIPDEKLDIHNLLRNLTLLPLKAGKKLTVGLTGGMDIRALAAIYLGSGMELSATHFGDDSTRDFALAKDIAAYFKLPFRHISLAEASGGWEQVQEYIFSRGFGFNPASSRLMAYFPILAEESEVFVSGCFGELYRFRFMAAHIKSIFSLKRPDYHSFFNYLYLQPPSCFIPEVNKALHEGFRAELKAGIESLPPADSMPAPLWMNLLLTRFCPHTMYMPDLCYIDHHLLDFMPYLQPSVAGQHWHYGYMNQLNEGLHRRTIKQNAQELSRFDLAIVDSSASYHLRPIPMKLVSLLHQRRKPRQNPNLFFLKKYEKQIRDLAESPLIKQDAWIDPARLKQNLEACYRDEPIAQQAILAFVSYALGKG